MQRVISPLGQPCGTILWESKRTKNWSDGWLTKLRDDQRTAKAEVAVIVSQVLPRGVDTFEPMDGVWVTHPRVALPLAVSLRHALVDIASARQASEGQQTKTEMVYQYLTGPRFRQRVEAIVEAFSSMQEELNTERKVIMKQWAKREEQIDRVMQATVGMYGDPDVHFSGFATDRTKSGDFKSRRLGVKAKSYGVELASAVSSLSESKLNALGLSVSIASSIRSAGPWDFLIIDDPIQSWDDEHETQFIEVIRGLVEDENKQVVVLSHKGTWAKQVCQRCRTLNGMHYEITGYTKDGPHIALMEWSPIDQRLREAENIADNATATSVSLQQAEQEIRLAACQAASLIAGDRLGRTTSSHNMNAKDVRAILVEAGVDSKLVDRISAMFITADDAHHAPRNYAPNRQRIRQASAAIREVLK